MYKYCLLIAAVAAEVSLKYVFEIVRHGARAPIYKDSKFSISDTQMLTPQGMRQRYLLGKYNHEKYAKELGGHDILKPDGFFNMQSTDVFRTIQSGYSELMGLYHSSGKIQPQLTHQQKVNLDAETRGMVPFLTRKIKDIKIVLDHNATVAGFVDLPIYTYIQYDLPAPQWEDDLNVGSCPQVTKDSKEREKDDAIYTDQLYLRDQIADTFAAEFGKTPQ